MKRYDFDEVMIFRESELGEWVKYEDFDNLLTYCAEIIKKDRQLSTEVSELKKAMLQEIPDWIKFKNGTM